MGILVVVVVPERGGARRPRIGYPGSTPLGQTPTARADRQQRALHIRCPVMRLTVSRGGGTPEQPVHIVDVDA
jgi:hypothetical protein